MRKAGEYSLNFLLVITAAVVVVFALVKLRLVVVPVIVTLFLTALLYPLARRLEVYMRGSLASLLVVVGFLVACVGVIALIVPPVIGEFAGVQAAVREGLRQVSSYLAGPPLELSQPQVERTIDEVLSGLRPAPGNTVSTLISGAFQAAEVAAGIVLVIVLLFFFLRDGRGMWEWILSWFPARRRERIDLHAGRAWGTLGRYLGGVALIALFDTTFIGLALFVIGVPLVFPLMMLVFVGAFFPVVGATVAGLIAALVALVSNGPIDALLVIAAIVVIQQLEGNLLYPVVVGRRVRLHPVVTLLAFTAGASVAGILGALISVPVAAMVGVVLEPPEEPPPEAAPVERRSATPAGAG
jgi:predicted PurR-regulated permease PerM